ncbi:hypothetical protein MPL3365_180236 [Mesorhizobium plurifarium]|uniref:Uncharacterized protein n=1 Tax=Mesorhizobium plurifarium TaxID=69974 RepID=A0A090GTM6_MESPL|nr:hypothetical protein MPL3365_180236 [Mesorhizobium plurifarium]
MFCSALGLEVQIENLGERQIAETFRALVEKQWDRIEERAVRVIATVPDGFIAKLQVYASSLADFQHHPQYECRVTAVGLLCGSPLWTRTWLRRQPQRSPIRKLSASEGAMSLKGAPSL